MKIKWKTLTLEVGAALPIEPLVLEHSRYKYLECPLCLQHCTESYWNSWHKKSVHLKCPRCGEWFSKKQGLGLHLSRSYCSKLILAHSNEKITRVKGAKVLIVNEQDLSYERPI